MSTRSLVIGASGQVGAALLSEVGPDVVGAARQSGELRIDLSDPTSIDHVLAHARPTQILIAGAWTWVDGAEADPDACRACNVEGPRQIAEWAAARNATVVYYSTDHVFDGSGNPHEVDDAPHPLNVYAQSKVEGEQAIRESGAEHLIIRTAWVYGPDAREKNFALRLVNELRAGRTVAVPQDQWGTPTFAPDLAMVTARLLDEGRRGTVHAVGPDYLDRLTLSRRICAAFGLDDAGLRPTTTAELGQAARRPLQVRLSTRDCPEASAIRGIDEGLTALAAWFDRQEAS